MVDFSDELAKSLIGTALLTHSASTQIVATQMTRVTGAIEGIVQESHDDIFDLVAENCAVHGRSTLWFETAAKWVKNYNPIGIALEIQPKKADGASIGIASVVYCHNDLDADPVFRTTSIHRDYSDQMDQKKTVEMGVITAHDTIACFIPFTREQGSYLKETIIASAALSRL